jgi:hypothetical protein
MNKNHETLTKEIAEKIVKNAGSDNQDETRAALAQFSEINADAAEALATQLAPRVAEFPNVQSLSLATAQALGKMGRSWIVLDGLTSLTPDLAKALAPGGALSLQGVKKLDKDTAKELAQQDCALMLSGLEEASDATIEALAGTKADLFLNSLANISDSALEKLVRFNGQKLVLGLKELSEKQARLFELYHGRSLTLGSLRELSDAAAVSLSRLSVDYLGLGGVQYFGEIAAKHLTSLKGRLTLSGRLEISQKALEALQSGDHLSSWLSLSGWIELPDYAYEIIRTEGVINRAWVLGYDCKVWSNDPQEKSPHLDGAVLTLQAAQALCYSGRSSRPYQLRLDKLQSLPDDVAAVLKAHVGSLSIHTDRKPSVAALTSLAGRKCVKNNKADRYGILKSSLELGIKDLDEDEAMALSGCACPLELHITQLSEKAASALANCACSLGFPKLQSLSEEAASALAKYKGDLGLGGPGRFEYWMQDTLLQGTSQAAIKLLGKKKEGTISGEKPSSWSKEALKRKRELEKEKTSKG